MSCNAPEHWLIPYEDRDEAIKTAMPMVRQIVDKCGWDIFQRSSVFYDRAECALEMAMTRPVSRALEIGTYHGLASAVMSQWCDQVYTVDIKQDIIDPTIKVSLWDALGIKNIKSFTVNNEMEKEWLIKTLEFDFCYMDGNHTNYTFSDWIMVRKCRRILFHEYWTKQMPVFDLVNSLPQQEIKIYRCNGKPTHYAYWEGI